MISKASREAVDRLVAEYPLTFDKFSEDELDYIAAAIDAAVLAERERCALICRQAGDSIGEQNESTPIELVCQAVTAYALAAKVRHPD